jgi:hypothetical protein
MEKTPLDHDPEVREEVATVRIIACLAEVDQTLAELGIDPSRLPKYDPGLLHASREEALVEARIWLYRSLGRQPEPPEKPKRRRTRPKRNKQKRKRR